MTPTLGSTTVCEDAFPIDLSTLQDPGFPTGTWSGMGVVGSVFDPNDLSGPITLTFTSDAACTLPATTTITVNVPVAPVLMNASICVTGSTLDLTTLQDPNFPTGTWSGPGVTGTTFNPIGQSGPVGLNFTPSDPCSLEGTAVVTVNEAPGVINITTDCDAGNLNYTVSFEIINGDPTSYTVDGVPLGGNIFTSGLIPTGTPYSFSVDDGNSCGPNVVAGVFDCTCVTFAGTMDIAAGPINICNGDAFSIASFFNNDEFLDADDIFNFIIHDNPGNQLGDTFGLSNTGNFNFPGGVILGQSYYVSPVAGSDDGTGKIDFMDPCLSVGQGIEIIFYQPTFSGSVPTEICEGECYDWELMFNGFPDFTLDYDIVTNAGTFSESATSNQNTLNITICPGILGASSGTVEIVPLNLDDLNCNNPLINQPSFITQINEIPETNLSTTLCPGESITVNGVIYDETNPTGTETLVGASTTGCDSIVMIDLTYFPEAIFDLDQTLCEGNSITINGTVYDESNPTGTEILIGGSVNGCDSTINIDLSFSPAIVEDLILTLCEGENIVVNGMTYDATNPVGTETIIGGSVLGCDSIINVDLSFFVPNVVDINTSLCTGESLTVNGTVYDASNPIGTEVLLGGDMNGCDSTINIQLDFFPEAIETLDQTLCIGSSITVNGVVYDESNPGGTEIIVGGDVNGCDSTIIIDLSFNAAVTFDLIETLCPGEEVVVNGVSYNAGNPIGTETIIGGSSQGCDSIINVNLSYFADAVSDLNQTLCEGEQIIINGTTYDITNQMGTEILPNASVNGCDSTINVQLEFNLNSQSDLNLTLCPGESIVVNGTTYDAMNTMGTETLPGGNFNGCDSIIVVDIEFFPEAVSDFETSLCEGESIIFNGTTYDESNPSGTEILPNASVNGCDSTINVTVIFNAPSTFDFFDTLCEGESLVFNGTTYNEGNPTGMEIIPNGNYLGCDSIINIELDFFPPAEGNLDVTLCEGEQIVVNGTIYDEGNPSGTEILVGASINGCDSTLQVNVEFESPSFGTLETTLCEGDFIVINGTTYNANNPSGQEIFSGGNAVGCDSTLTINLSYYPPATGTLNLTLSPDSSIVVNGTTYDIDNPSGVEVFIGGSYTGCDSTLIVDLNFEASITLFAEGNGPTCFGDNDGSLVIDTIIGAKPPYSLSIDGENFFTFSDFPIVWPGLEGGFYDITLIDANDFMATIEILVPIPNDNQIDLGPDTLVNLGESLILNTAINFFPEELAWTPNDFLDCDSCLSVQLTPLENTLYTVTAIDSFGCEAVDQIQVLVRKDRDLFIPNAFSPNNDGVNDKLIVFAGNDVVQIRRFQVFNRWGGLVHNQIAFQPNDPTYGWDGFFNGKPVDTDVFVYYVEVEYADGVIEVKKGDVMLVR